MKKPTTFHDTTHAGVRRNERGVSLEEMKQTVCEHERRVQYERGMNGGFIYEFQKTVAGKKLVVIAEVKKQECWLITGYYEES